MRVRTQEGRGRSPGPPERAAMRKGSRGVPPRTPARGRSPGPLKKSPERTGLPAGQLCAGAGPRTGGAYACRAAWRVAYGSGASPPSPPVPPASIRPFPFPGGFG